MWDRRSPPTPVRAVTGPRADQRAAALSEPGGPGRRGPAGGSEDLGTVSAPVLNRRSPGRAYLRPTDTWPLPQLLPRPCELVGDANRLADLAHRFFVVLLDAGIDDE